MTPPSPPPGNALADLLREAGAATRAGDLSEAERLYRKVVDRSPANVEAWLGLGTVLSDPAEKAACFERVLEIDPQDADAAASLQRVRAVLPVSAQSEPLTCAFHPQVQTTLRCSQCGRPICTRCARPFQVGQLCPICLRGRRPEHYRPSIAQLAAAGGATLGASAVAGLLATFVVSWSIIVAILGGPLVGSMLAQVALWAGQRHRGLAVQIAVGLCGVVGSLLGGAILRRLGILADLYFLLYAGLAVASAVAWLK